VAQAALRRWRNAIGAAWQTRDFPSLDSLLGFGREIPGVGRGELARWRAIRRLGPIWTRLWALVPGRIRTSIKSALGRSADSAMDQQ
jgi:hypothetical protein